VDDTGLMDESFFLYGEDVDWCKCMWQSNWPVHYLAQGGVVHYDGASQPDYVGRRLRQLGGVRQYVRKWHGRTYARAYAAIVWVCSLYRYVAFNWRRHRLGAMGEWLAPYIRFYRTIVLGPKGLRRES
jgi:GT2 family glycosyltransferase